MFNIGMGELIFIGVIALIFIGPKQLPEVARVVARFINELRHASNDLTGSFTNLTNDTKSEFKKALDASRIHEALDRIQDLPLAATLESSEPKKEIPGTVEKKPSEEILSKTEKT